MPRSLSSLPSQGRSMAEQEAPEPIPNPAYRVPGEHPGDDVETRSSSSDRRHLDLEKLFGP